MDTSRTSNSLKNMAFGVGSQMLSILMGFFTRWMFIALLGKEYLGCQDYSQMCFHCFPLQTWDLIQLSSIAYINRLQKGIWLLLKAICAYIGAYIERLEQLYLCSAVS